MWNFDQKLSGGSPFDIIWHQIQSLTCFDFHPIYSISPLADNLYLPAYVPFEGSDNRCKMQSLNIKTIFIDLFLQLQNNKKRLKSKCRVSNESRDINNIW